MTPADRCSCGHTRAAHDGRPDRREAYPTGCGVMICGCEVMRAEGDR